MSISTIAYFGLILFLAVAPANLFAAGVVTNATEADLRAAMTGGGTVTFAVDGTIVLSNTLVITNNTVLDASGRSMVISGNHLVRVLYVNQGITLNLTNLTVANGDADSGGGMYNAGGNVNLWQCKFSDNQAHGIGGQFFYNEACGGAIYNAVGTLTAASTIFAFNTVTGAGPTSVYYGGPGFPGFGGAVVNNGFATLIECTFATNSVVGGVGYFGALSPVPETYAGNWGCGGGLCNRGTTDVSRCTFVANLAQGGKGTTLQPGFGPTANTAGKGGTGLGGGFASIAGRLVAVNCTLFGNQAWGGDGGDSWHWNISPFGGRGGVGWGGAVFSTNSLAAFTNCTIATNIVSAGAGGISSDGTRFNGSIGTATNGGIAQTNSTMRIQNCVVSGNSAGDVAGTFTGNHDVIGIDARLGPLADNGGLTKTLALLPDSPAIDAADPASAPTTDQRGVSRPVGSAPDIGAYEWNGTSFYTDFFVRPPALMNGIVNLLVVGPPNQTFRLQTSTSFGGWSDIITNTTDSYGLRSLSHPVATGGGLHLYRSISP